MEMDASINEVAQEFPPFLRVFKDGSVERFMASPYFPPTTNPNTGVETKDIVISSDLNLKARVCIPKVDSPDQKLPLVVHYHGGGFCIGSAFGTVVNQFISSLAFLARALVVSVEYRLAPEHPLPIAFDDSWTALQWIATHLDGKGSEPCINQHADFRRVFIVGESAGATLAHYVAVQAGITGLDLGIKGLVVAHPYFADKKPDKLIQFLYPSSSGADDDPKLSPVSDPHLSKMKCSKVLVCLASKDWLKPRGMAYYETLKDSGWGGSVTLMENEGEDHCFYLFNGGSEKALDVMQRFAAFIIQQD